MHIHFHKLEVLVDRLVPLSLFILLLVIGTEFYYPDTAAQYHLLLTIFDQSIIALFIVDLVFKYIRVHRIPLFLKKYWLEIIAVLPLSLLIRTFEYAVPLQRLDLVSDSAHGMLETGAKWGIVVKEVEAGGQASRLMLSTRYLRLIIRMPRLIQALVFYERPTGRHHPHDWNFVPHTQPSRL